MMPGTAFYVEDGKFCEVEQDGEESEAPEEELEILKIPAKSGNSTLLFEPRDIDYVESRINAVICLSEGTRVSDTAAHV